MLSKAANDGAFDRSAVMEKTAAAKSFDTDSWKINTTKKLLKKK